MEKGYMNDLFTNLINLSVQDTETIFNSTNPKDYIIKIDIVEFDNYMISQETWKRSGDGKDIPELTRKFIIPKIESITKKFLEDGLKRAIEIEDYEAASDIDKKIKELEKLEKLEK
jgi:hypothetical protein